MKVVCKREPLLAAVQLAAGVVPSRTPKAILQSLKLVADERITLYATDLEVGLQCPVKDDEANVAEPGEALLPASQASSILREMRDETVTLSTSRRGTLIEGTRSRFELASEDPADYPEVPGFEGQRFHRIESELLRVMVRRTVFATDPENTRYALGGVLLELEGETVRLVATDGRRLALMEGTGEAVGDHSTAGTTTVVPAKAMNLLERHLSGEKEATLVSVSENRIVFATPKATIISRLLEGRFPAYEAVIPKRHTGQMSVQAGELMRAVRQAAVVTTEESRGVTWELDGTELKIVGYSHDVGRSEVYVTAAYEGPPLKVAFDPRYLLDMLKTLDEGVTVRLDLIDSESAAVFRTDDGYLYVLMPLALEEEPSESAAEEVGA